MIKDIIYKKIKGTIVGGTTVPQGFASKIHIYEIQLNSGKSIKCGHKVPAPEFEPGTTIEAYIPRITNKLNYAACGYEISTKNNLFGVPVTKSRLVNIPYIQNIQKTGSKSIFKLDKTKEVFSKMVEDGELNISLPKFEQPQIHPFSKN